MRVYVCLCLCMCMCTCMRVYAHVYMYVYVYVHANAYVYICMRICVYFVDLDSITLSYLIIYYSKPSLRKIRKPKPIYGWHHQKRVP